MFCASNSFVRLAFSAFVGAAFCTALGSPVSGEPTQSDTVVLQNSIAQFLQEWKQRLGDVESFRVRYRRIDYSATFKTQTETTGECLYAGDRRWSGRRDDGAEHWIRHEDQLYLFSRETKTVRLLDLRGLPSREDIGGFWGNLVRALSEDPLAPFLLGLRVDELQQKYEVKIAREDEETLRLDLHLRRKDDDRLFRRAQLLLDQETYHPRAVKLHGLNGKDSQVYLLKSLELNVPIAEEEFQPDLEGWRVISLSALFGKRAD